ncbi:MAG: hypothetical protein KHX03_01170 [Clostridium sp.]|nr:hypothetical protein [Clostridium sp.]
MNKRAKEALDILLEGNRNFVSGKNTAVHRTVDDLKSLQNGQSPIACVVTCSDSRVIPELVFDKGFGDIFVVRCAGVVIGENVLESVEYAVDHLKVPLVMVLSHDDCGVMKAAKALYPKEPDHLELLIRSVYEIIDSETECYNELARNYTLTKKRKLLKRSKILRQAHHEGKFEIVRAYLKFDTGEVVIVED